jgi:hypothetical protein
MPEPKDMSDVDTVEDARDFTSRQLVHEFAGGATLAEAASRVRGALLPALHWTVDEVERMFAGNEAPAFPQLGAVLEAAHAGGGSAERAFVAYERSARDFRPKLVAAFAGAATFGAYLACLVLILTIVVSVYTIFVLPQFELMFGMFGTPLPGMTRAVLGSYWLVVPVLLLLLVALVTGFFGLRAVKLRLLRLQPVRPSIGKVPGFGSWSARYDSALWIRYYAIFFDAGLVADAARTAASRLAGAPADNDYRQRLLASADALGRLREELAEQLERDSQQSLEQFEAPRNAAAVLIRALIYLLVGTYVMAMYLPIFKLGAIV